MLVVRYIRWLYRLLNGEERPWQIALGFCLGGAFGLVPFGLVSVAGLLLTLVINCHFGSAVFGYAVSAALLKPLLGESVAYPLGHWLIETGPRGFYRSLALGDGVSLLRLHSSAVVGGLALGTLLGLPLFVFVTIFVRRFRARFRERLGKSRAMRALGNMWLFRALRWLVIG